MLRGAVTLCLLLLSTGFAGAQDRFIGVEPEEDLIGAPRYPGAVFIRTIDALDAYYQSVLYMTTDSPDDVLNFFRRGLGNVRTVSFDEDGVQAWAFLLAPWIELENLPERSDLIVLDSAPNIQVKAYNRGLYEPLIEYFRTHEGYGKQVDMLEKARTVIRYTYERPEDTSAAEQIAGTWKNTSRDQPGYYGSVLQLTEDGTYSLTFTGDNLRYLAEELASTPRYSGTDVEEIMRDLEERNPETGDFDILRNYITLSSDHPVAGSQTKSGTATVKSFSLSLQIGNLPALAFIRQPE